MKYKFIRDKKSGETRIDYYKVAERDVFRYETLKRLINNEDIVISIDTNLMKSQESHQNIAMAFEEKLKADHIQYEVFPITNTREKKILGIPMMKSSGEKAFSILINLNGQDIKKDFFDKYFLSTDVLIGIQPKKSFEEICKDVQKGYMTSFFDKSYFEWVLYDSDYISSIRITKSIEPF